MITQAILMIFKVILAKINTSLHMEMVEVRAEWQVEPVQGLFRGHHKILWITPNLETNIQEWEKGSTLQILQMTRMKKNISKTITMSNCLLQLLTNMMVATEINSKWKNKSLFWMSRSSLSVFRLIAWFEKLNERRLKL